MVPYCRCVSGTESIIDDLVPRGNHQCLIRRLHYRYCLQALLENIYVASCAPRMLMVTVDTTHLTMVYPPPLGITIHMPSGIMCRPLVSPANWSRACAFSAQVHAAVLRAM